MQQQQTERKNKIIFHHRKTQISDKDFGREYRKKKKQQTHTKMAIIKTLGNRRSKTCEYILVTLIKLLLCSYVICVSEFSRSSLVHAIHWEHSVNLNDDYRLMWNIYGQEITFEVQARTLGYVGLGFSPDGRLPGSDVVIGWVSQGQVHFQVSEIILFLLFLYSPVQQDFLQIVYVRSFVSIEFIDKMVKMRGRIF